MHQYYFHSVTRRLALLCAVPLCVVGLFLWKPQIALTVAAAAALLLSLVILPLYLWIEDRKYRRAQKELPMQVTFRDRILLRLQNDGACSGCLYLCRYGLWLLSFSKKGGMLLTYVPRRCVWQLQLQEHEGQIRICFYDHFFYEFYCVREEALLQRLRKDGWSISEPPTA